MSAFTSDLSVSDFALCHQLGLQPISQVMGSSIYQVGYQPSAPGFGFEGEAGELQVLSQAWNESRRLAFSRLAQEAEKVGCSAVVGVQIKAGSGGIAAASGIQSIEYTVMGTAVRRAGHSGAPILTELSVADYGKLLHAGIEPAGVVAHTSVFFVSGLYISSERQLPFGSSMQNYELTRITQSFYAAREQVMGEIGAQARALNASGIVGARIGHSAAPQTIGAGRIGETQRNVVMVTMSAIGTAIHHSEAGIKTGIGAVAAGSPPLKTTMDLLS